MSLISHVSVCEFVNTISYKLFVGISPNLQDTVGDNDKLFRLWGQRVKCQCREEIWYDASVALVQFQCQASSQFFQSFSHLYFNTALLVCRREPSKGFVFLERSDVLLMYLSVFYLYRELLWWGQFERSQKKASFIEAVHVYIYTDYSVYITANFDVSQKTTHWRTVVFL